MRNSVEPERVLMVVRAEKGGAFNHALRLCHELQARGWECAICGPHPQTPAELGTRVFVVDIPRHFDPKAHLAAVAELSRIYGEFKPAIVHAHGSQGGVIARLARLRHPTVPIVFTPHNYAFLNYFTSRFARLVYKTIEVLMAPLATRVVCVCARERRAAARIGPARRTRLVYNGIRPLAPASPRDDVARLAAPGPVIVTTAELQPAKGLPTLIGAMPRVLSEHPHAKLVIAGEGPQRAELERRIAELGIGDSVYLPGAREDIAGLLTAATLYVQPSWSESFPYSVLEAMSLASPIVATDVGGVGEAIEDGVTGLLVPPHDEERLAGAMIELLDNPTRAANLGSAAKERQLARFGYAGMIEGTLAVYDEIRFSES